MMAPPIKKRSVIRFLIILAAAALVAGLWYGLQRPRTFHVVAHYPLGAPHPEMRQYGFQQNGRWLPTGLLRWSIPDTSRQPITLYFDGWDGKTHWQVTAPAATRPERPRKPYEVYYPPIAYSPNGQYVALLFTDGPQVRVFSWRDGKPDVAARLTTAPGTLETDYRLSVADDGRVWVHTAFLHTCRLWRLDGRRVATGTFVTPFKPYQEGFYAYRLAPDGSVLVPAQLDNLSNNTLSLYVSLDVEGNRIVATPRHTVKGSVTVHENGIISERHEYYDADGHIAEETARRRLRKPTAEPAHAFLTVQHIEIGPKHWVIPRESETVTLPDGTSWTVVTYRAPMPFAGSRGYSGLDPGACSADGRYLLMIEDVRPAFSQQLLPRLARIEALKRMLITRMRPARLSLYRQPGKLSAGVTVIKTDLTLRKGKYRVRLDGEYYWITDWALSPDGRRIGLHVYREKTDTREFLVCRW